MLRQTLILITCLLSLSLAYGQDYREAPCPRLLILSEVEGETVTCGFLTVPETRGNSGDATLELAVMTLKAKTDMPEPDPILFLQGGPGGAALSTVEAWQNLPWRETRDIILLDQRGTGYSTPNLKCDELYDFEATLPAAAGACRTRLLRAGHDLRAFNSKENAADVEALRRALEVEAFNLYGVSYGTRLALTVMREHPAGVRSVVLDSTYPPQVNRLVEFGANFERALKQVFTACAADATCSAAFPDLQRRFSNRIYTANDSPLELFEGLELSGSDLLSVYFQGMYNEAAIRTLPYSMAKLADDNLGDALLLLSGVVTGEEVDSGQGSVLAILRVLRESLKWFWREVQSEGVYFSTECQEDVPFQTPNAALEAADALPPTLRRLVEETIYDQFAACRSWRVPRANSIESEPVTSDIPTLVLAGSFDPITPPSWGRLAAETLENSHFFEFPNAAHGVFVSGACPVGMVSEFLESPKSEPDASCIADIDLEFYVPEDN